MNFTEINCENLNMNAFKLIGKDWMLITSGNKEKFNTMTASWGSIGVLWNKNIATISLPALNFFSKTSIISSKAG